MKPHTTRRAKQVVVDVTLTQVRDWAHHIDVTRSVQPYLPPGDTLHHFEFLLPQIDLADDSMQFVGNAASDLLWTLRARSTERRGNGATATLPRSMEYVARSRLLWSAIFIVRRLRQREKESPALERLLQVAVARKEAAVLRAASPNLDEGQPVLQTVLKEVSRALCEIVEKRQLPCVRNEDGVWFMITRLTKVATSETVMAAVRRVAREKAVHPKCSCDEQPNKRRRLSQGGRAQVMGGCETMHEVVGSAAVAADVQRPTDVGKAVKVESDGDLPVGDVNL